MPRVDKPTREHYAELQKAYDFFNRRLFFSKLPPCMITVQQFRKCAGYHLPEGWQDENGVLRDEISLNPAHIMQHSNQDGLMKPLSTLVHEQSHSWQHHFGMRKSKRGYHNRKWAKKMREVGLIPSSTGEPGGKGGRFDEAASALVRGGFTITWTDNWNRQPQGQRKAHYKCDRCGVSCWGKPKCFFICGDCERRMTQLDSGQ